MERHREERQAEFQRIGRWFNDLHHRRPFVFNLLSLTDGLVMFAIAHFLSKGQHR